MWVPLTRRPHVSTGAPSHHPRSQFHGARRVGVHRGRAVRTGVRIIDLAIIICLPACTSGDSSVCEGGQRLVDAYKGT